jgi:hypothetical protein
MYDVVLNLAQENLYFHLYRVVRAILEISVRTFESLSLFVIDKREGFVEAASTLSVSLCSCNEPQLCTRK